MFGLPKGGVGWDSIALRAVHITSFLKPHPQAPDGQLV